MKLLVITFLAFFTTTNSYTQSLKEIKKDSIVKIADTDLSLIYYKKTTAVWHNLANFNVVEPTKNWFIYLNSAELLVEVDYKHKTFYAIVQDELTGGYKRFLLGENKFIGNLYSSKKGCYILKQTIKINDSYFDLSLKKVENTIIGTQNGKVSLEFWKKNIIVTDYKINNDNSEVIQSIQYPGEDSVSSNYKTCYVKGDFNYSVSNSAMYNYKKREWVLSQKYNTINYYKSELITNRSPTNLNQLNSQVWRKKHCQWVLMSPSYASIEKVGDIYSCRTKQDTYGQSSFILLDKNLTPIKVNDFYNFDLVESTDKGIKVTPIISNPTLFVELNFNGNLLNTDN